MKKTHVLLLALIVSALMLLGLSCAKTARPPAEEESPSDRVPLNPISTAVDREVVPEIYPIYVALGLEVGDSLVTPKPAGYEAYDSALAQINPTEVFRVQIYTSRLYAEAARELAIANEIFNQPVHLDYEVPYYKLRVGDFTSREEAEDMVPEIKAIGYRGAWVARVVQKIRETPIFDERDAPILPSNVPDTVFLEPEEIDSTGGGGER